jgi:hypothetical protein
LVVTKLDGTAKGGVVLAIAQKLKFPSASSAWASSPRISAYSTRRNSYRRC